MQGVVGGDAVGVPGAGLPVLGQGPAAPARRGSSLLVRFVGAGRGRAGLVVNDSPRTPYRWSFSDICRKGYGYGVEFCFRCARHIAGILLVALLGKVFGTFVVSVRGSGLASLAPGLGPLPADLLDPARGRVVLMPVVEEVASLGLLPQSRGNELEDLLVGSEPLRTFVRDETVREVP